MVPYPTAYKYNYIYKRKLVSLLSGLISVAFACHVVASVGFLSRGQWTYTAASMAMTSLNTAQICGLRTSLCVVSTLWIMIVDSVYCYTHFVENPV